MEEEKKTPEGDVEDTKENPEGEKPEGTEPLQEKIDYNAIAEAEEKRGRPDPIKAELAFKERQAKREDKEKGDDGDDDDKPMTRRELMDFLSQQNQQTHKILSESNAKSIADKLSESPEEARAILATWRNRQFPEGMSIQDQIEETYAVVNRTRLVSQRNEALRALANKDTISKDTTSTHKDPAPGNEPKLSAPDRKALITSGYVWDGVKRMWKKPIQGGKKHLWLKDIKSKPIIE